MSCCDENVVKLPAPTFDEKLKLSEAIVQRRSVRKYDGHELSLQEIANLCYFSAGITDKDRGLKANPTACNAQEIQLYVVRECCACLYVPEEHALHVIERGDFRAEMGGQPFVKDASVNFVYVRSNEKFDHFPFPEGKAKYEITDSAIMATLTCLYAESIGLHSVIRGLIDPELIAKRLHLPEKDLAILSVSVG